MTRHRFFPELWALGEATTLAFLAAVEARQDLFLERINATAGPRWMPAIRPKHA